MNPDQDTEKIFARKRDAETVNSVDRYMADLFRRMAPQTSDAFLATVQLLLAGTREGHVCLELIPESPWSRLMSGMGIAPENVREEIRNSSLAGSSELSVTPLVLAGNRLYLHRYFSVELAVARGLSEKKARIYPLPEVTAVKRALDRHFPEESLYTGLDMQKFSAFAAIRNSLCVITGGPGTGKTSTVCRMLACLCDVLPQPPEILLAAPTGKAASRLAFAISEEKLRLAGSTESYFKAIPEKAFTLHKMLRLGQRRRSSERKDFILPADIVVVDEVSMVDIFLMARLLSSMRKDARLILLGDRFQLASVSPGAVLGEICRDEQGRRSQAFIADFKKVFEKSPPFESSTELFPMEDCLVGFSRSWRFRPDGGIGLFAGLLNAGKGKEAGHFLEENMLGHFEGWEDTSEISFYSGKTVSEIKAFLRPLILKFFSPYLKAQSPEEAFFHFSSFGFLSFLRKGPLGVEALNAFAEEILSEAGLIDPREPWYAGRPVLVVQNDPASGLFNGDVGLCLKTPDTEGERMVFFPDEGKNFRAVFPMRLPRVENAFCMTVHKSQGSEWDTLFLILPEKHSPILTREALYTGVTRAKKRLILAGDPESVGEGARKSLFRASGLGDFLWGQGNAD